MHGERAEAGCAVHTWNAQRWQPIKHSTRKRLARTSCAEDVEVGEVVAAQLALHVVPGAAVPGMQPQGHFPRGLDL